MVKEITGTELRIRLGEYLDRANLSRETFVITRKGRGKAILLSPDAYLQLVETVDALKAGKKPPSTPDDEGNVLTHEELRRLIQ